MPAVLSAIPPEAWFEAGVGAVLTELPPRGLKFYCAGYARERRNTYAAIACPFIEISLQSWADNTKKTGIKQKKIALVAPQSSTLTTSHRELRRSSHLSAPLRN